MVVLQVEIVLIILTYMCYPPFMHSSYTLSRIVLTTKVFDTMTQMNLLMAETDAQTQRNHRFVIAKGEGVGGGMDWNFEINRCKPLYRMDKQ